MLSCLLTSLGCSQSLFDAHGGGGNDGGAPGGGADTSECKPAAFKPIGAEYFIGPAGDDRGNGTSESTAWSTFDRAWLTLQPGDALTILDGVYRQPLRPTISGAPGMPIVIRALNDGAAIIDGEDVRSACTISGSTSALRLHDIDLIGVRCTNAKDPAAGGEPPVSLSFVDRVRVLRVTARGHVDGVFRIANTTDVLLEDVAGYGDRIFSLVANVNPVIRRCYGRWTGGSEIMSRVSLLTGMFQPTGMVPT